MIYTENTKKAMKIAFEAHLNQVDKAGIPYIYHPIHVAEQMNTETECIVAILHDVLEDTDVTVEYLSSQFDDTVIEALLLLKHDDSIDYMDYIEKLKRNSIARKVKKYDLLHNMDKTRLQNVTEKDRKRIKKYEKALLILSK